MAQVTPQEINALAQVNGVKEFMVYLEKRAKEYSEKIILAEDEVQMRIYQGRARENLDLLNLIKNAPSIARKA